MLHKCHLRVGLSEIHNANNEIDCPLAHIDVALRVSMATADASHTSGVRYVKSNVCADVDLFRLRDSCDTWYAFKTIAIR